MAKQSVHQVAHHSRFKKQFCRGIVAALAGTIVATSMVAPPSEAAKVVSAPGANCGLYTITVNTGLEENVYKPYEKFYYVVDLQKWNGAEWKNVDRFPKQGWGVGNVSDDPSISTAYLHGHYRVEASFIWFDQNSGRYKSWTSTNGYKVDIAHFGLRKGERGNHYCTY